MRSDAAEDGCASDSDEDAQIVLESIDSTPKPPLSYVLKGITSACSWTVDSREVLAACTLKGSTEDHAVRTALSSDLTADPESIYFTLLALYILEVCYDEDKDEWGLIARKANQWLR